MSESMIERVAEAIERKVRELSSGDCSFDYVGPNGQLASVEIARAAIKAFHKALCEGDYFWMECQECAAGRRIDDLVKSFPEGSTLNKSPPPQQ